MIEWIQNIEYITLRLEKWSTSVCHNCCIYSAGKHKTAAKQLQIFYLCNNINDSHKTGLLSYLFANFVSRLPCSEP